MKPETFEEKKWFLLGYLYCQAQSFAEEFGYTIEESQKMIMSVFQEGKEKK